MCPAFRTNHRYLVRGTDRYNSPIDEIKVLEVSPQGRIKVLYPAGATFWKSPGDYTIVEDLGEDV